MKKIKLVRTNIVTATIVCAGPFRFADNFTNEDQYRIETAGISIQMPIVTRGMASFIFEQSGELRGIVKAQCISDLAHRLLRSP